MNPRGHGVTIDANDKTEQAAMATPGIKDEAKRLIEGMPDDATWDDPMHEVYVRQAIEQGLTDSETGRTWAVTEVRAKYGLSS